MQSRVTCAMCGHQTPAASAGGRGFVECSCGMRIEVAAARPNHTAPVAWALGLVAAAAGMLYWLSRQR